MVRKLMTAALILTLGLALTACGNETAGTAANRWTGTNAASQEWAIQRQSDARGPLEDRGNGAYHADETGRVDGYHTDSADGTRGSAKEDMKDAGKNLGNAAKDAAKGAGNAVKDAAKGAGDARQGRGRSGQRRGAGRRRRSGGHPGWHDQRRQGHRKKRQRRLQITPWKKQRWPSHLCFFIRRSKSPARSSLWRSGSDKSPYSRSWCS